MNISAKKSLCCFLTLFLMLSLFCASPLLAVSPKTNKPAAEKKLDANKTQALSRSEQKKILALIRQKYSRKVVFSGRFTQKTIYADSNETTLSLGLIWIKGPDKMRWEYQSPEKQILVSDGKTVWYYTPDLNQVMIGKVNDIREARVLLDLMAKLKLEQKGFRLNLSRDRDLVVVTLTPLSGDQAPPFQSMAMVFSASDYSLVETRMEDLFANKIVITYNWESSSHPDLPGVDFSFTPPAGCDIMPLGR